MSEGAPMQRVAIPARFRGPPTSANGGWTCGVVGRFVGAHAEVTLKSPPPLDVEMEIVEGAGEIVLRCGDVVVAEARAATTDVDPPPPVTVEEATDATRRYPWFEGHPYPSCFVCGPARGEDGLRIFPGAVAGRDIAAAPWTPPSDLAEAGAARPELLWAALDCPSWFGFGAFHDDHGLVLLGRLTADIRRSPKTGEQCVVGGWHVGREGRKIHCGSAVWSADGEVLALGYATWIELRKP